MIQFVETGKRTGLVWVGKRVRPIEPISEIKGDKPFDYNMYHKIFKEGKSMSNNEQTFKTVLSEAMSEMEKKEFRSKLEFLTDGAVDSRRAGQFYRDLARTLSTKHKRLSTRLAQAALMIDAINTDLNVFINELKRVDEKRIIKNAARGYFRNCPRCGMVPVDDPMKNDCTCPYCGENIPWEDEKYEAR